MTTKSKKINQATTIKTSPVGARLMPPNVVTQRTRVRNSFEVSCGGAPIASSCRRARCAPRQVASRSAKA